MGLDIHAGTDHFQMSYAGYNAWHEQLAKLEHLDLDQMRGYGGDRPWTDDFDSPSLTPLLNHSDCDGFLGQYECGRIAARLRELEPALAALPADLTWVADAAGRLLPLLDFAATNRVALEFR